MAVNIQRVAKSCTCDFSSNSFSTELSLDFSSEILESNVYLESSNERTCLERSIGPSKPFYHCEWASLLCDPRYYENNWPFLMISNRCACWNSSEQTQTWRKLGTCLSNSFAFSWWRSTCCWQQLWNSARSLSCWCFSSAVSCITYPDGKGSKT